MLQQRVHNMSYLAKAIINLDEIENGYKALVLPKGAEITHLSVEVLEEVASATLSVGLNENDNFFMNAIDIGTRKSYLSEVISSVKDISEITITTAGVAQMTSGKIVLRMIYFLPSQITTEY